MSVPGKHNISRSVWRFLEISLFFLVSVLGYSFLAKTSTFNAKSKSKELSSGIVAVQGCSAENTSMLFSFCEQSPASQTHNTPFYVALYQNPARFTSHNKFIPEQARTAPVFPFALNLFQQNQVLLI